MSDKDENDIIDDMADRVRVASPQADKVGMESGFNEDDLRTFLDDNGNVVGIGSVDDTYKIRHSKQPLIQNRDSIDKEVLEEALNCSLIKTWIVDLSRRSKFFKEAFESFFLMLFRDSVEFIEAPCPSDVYLMKLLTEVISHEDFEALHDSCMFNRANSALGAKTLVDAINELISDEDLEMLQKIDEMAQDMSGIMGKISQFAQAAQGEWTQGSVDEAGIPLCPGEGSLGPEGTPDPSTGEPVDPCTECGQFHPPMRPKTPKERGMTADEAREHLRNMTKQFSELMQEMQEKLQETLEKMAPKTEQAVKKAVGATKDRVDHVTQLVTDFGVEPGEYNKVPMEQILKIAERYKNEPRVRELLDKELGRMSKVARKTMKAMTETVSNLKSNPSVLEDNLTTMMPHEMVKSRHTKTKLDFKKRLLEKEVECFDTRGQRRVNRGPIIVCKDTSGSMRGGPNTWGSGLTLALSAMAFKQRRELVLINFGCEREIKSYEFKKGSDLNECIDAASFMFGGGTDFEAPLRQAADFISQSRYNQADVLFITDGCCGVSDSFLKEFRKLKKKRQFKVVSVVLNIGYGRQDVVDSFSDKTIYLSDIQKDEDVLNAAFAF